MPEITYKTLDGRTITVPAEFTNRSLRGYADVPGSGPTGETCGTCRHKARLRYAKTYYKCALQRGYWTHGPGTDIKLRSPACRKWESATDRDEPKED